MYNNNDDEVDENSEFVPLELRKKRYQSKDDAIYGVFKEGRDEDDEHKKSTTLSYFKPMNFVSSGKIIIGDKIQNINATTGSGATTTPSVDELTEEQILQMMQEPDNTESSTRSETQKSNADFAKLLSQPQAVPESKERSYTITQARSKQSTDQSKHSSSSTTSTTNAIPVSKDTKKDRDFGSFLDPKVGSKVLRMMQNMGWKEKGMGKNEEGIVNPIKVLKTGKHHAVVISDQHVQKTKTANKEEDEEEIKEEKPVVHRWKKSSAAVPKQKVAFKTVDDLLKKKAPTEKPKVQIIDMTGPEARVLSSFQELSTKNAGRFSVSAASQVLPELQHNIRELVTLTETHVQEVDMKIKQEKERMSQLDTQRQKLEDLTKSQAHTVASFKEVLKIASVCFERMTSSDNPLSLETVYNVFESIQLKHKSIYDEYKIAKSVAALAAPLIRARINDWNPLEQPQKHVHMISKWKKLLEPAPISAKSVVSDWKKDLLKTPTQDTNYYERLLEQVILPKLQEAYKSLNIINNSDAAVLLSESWFPILTEAMRSHIIDHLLLPKLGKAVENDWNVQDRPLIDTWVHPWLPILGSSYLLKMEQQFGIFPAIRRKITNYLNKWDPTNPFAHELLAPWRHVFDHKDFNKLILQSVVPKLIYTLRERLVIDPGEQDLVPFENVVHWWDTIPYKQMVMLMEAEFFPKWNKVLYEWLLQPECSIEEVTRWFYGWKSLIPESLSKSRKVQMQYSRAMDMINQASAHQTITPSHLLPPPSAVVGKKGKIATDKSKHMQDEYELSFKELIEQYAAQNDMIFIPKQGKVNGKQLYNFAGLSTYIDNDCLYLRESGEVWKPVTLDEFMEKAEAKAKKK